MLIKATKELFKDPPQGDVSETEKLAEAVGWGIRFTVVMTLWCLVALLGFFIVLWMIGTLSES